MTVKKKFSANCCSNKIKYFFLLNQTLKVKLQLTAIGAEQTDKLINSFGELVYSLRFFSTKFIIMRTITYLAISCLTLLFVALILVIVLFAKQ